MSKLQLHHSKVLKLQNVLIYKINVEEENIDLGFIVEKMQSYMKVKGTLQIGPLIQYTNVLVKEQEEINIDIYILLQGNNYIHSVEKPYKQEEILRIPHCMYCRYVGPKKK